MVDIENYCPRFFAAFFGVQTNGANKTAQKMVTKMQWVLSPQAAKMLQYSSHVHCLYVFSARLDAYTARWAITSHDIYIYISCYAPVKFYYSRIPTPLLADAGAGGDFGGEDNAPDPDTSDEASGSAPSPANAMPHADASAPWLENLHKLVAEYLQGKVVDGEKPRFDAGALPSPHFPWRNITEMLVSVWAIITRPSRKNLQMLLDLLHVEDSAGNRFDPRDVPRSAEHLIRRAREKLPLLPVICREVKGKGREVSQIVECPFNLVFQRMLRCPRVVEEFMNNFGGKQMSQDEHLRNRVPEQHLTPIATREEDGARRSFMNGTIIASSAHMGLDCVTTADGVRLYVGDTAMVNVQALGSAPIPARISMIFWQNTRKYKRRDLQLTVRRGYASRGLQLRAVQAEGEEDLISDESSSSWTSSSSSPSRSSSSSPSLSSSPSSSSASSGSSEDDEEVTLDAEMSTDNETSSGRLVVRVSPLLGREHMPNRLRNKRRLGEVHPSVWEVTNQHEDVGVEGLVGSCLVLPVGIDVATDPAAESMPTYRGEGFVETTGGSRRFKVVKEPWRRSGINGWYFDRRSPTAYVNVDGLPVVSMGFVASSDGFDYLSGNKRYSVRATYLAPACLTSALLRKLRSWWLVTLGVRTRWEEEMGPLTSIIRMLENGCRAEIRIPDGEAHTVGSTPRAAFGRCCE